MKNIKIFLLMAAIITAVGSCKKLEQINRNPNDASDVPPALLLTSSELAIAWAQGGDIERYTAMFTQHAHGAARQFAAYDAYSFTENDFDNVWKFNLYGGPLNDLYILRKKADEKGYKTYGAVARILTAYTMSMIVDLWGNAPYSEAFQGPDNLQPKFDNGADIYTACQTMLDEAVAALNAVDDGALQPGDDDFIYAGDPEAWKAFAYVLKARLHIHLTKISGTAATDALNDLAAGGFIGNGGNAQFIFGETQTSSNPWYQYIQERDDISYSGYLLDTMIGLGDPRYDKYIDTTGYPTDAIAGASAPITFMTYAEQKFIEAEAKQRNGDDGGAEAAYQEGILASMSQWGVDATDAMTYVGANGTLSGTQTEKIDMIMFQKYLALFLKAESYTDWRRTGSPALQPNAGAVMSEIPRRFIYPQSERIYNPNCPQNSSLLLDKIFWDN